MRVHTHLPRQIGPALLAAMLLTFSGAAYASEPPESITIDFASALNGGIHVEYETPASRNAVLAASVRYAVLGPEETTLRGPGGGLAYRLYLNGQAPSSFWLGGAAGMAIVSNSDVHAPAVLSGTAVDWAAHIGHRWIAESGFVANFYIGYGARQGTATTDTASLSLAASRLVTVNLQVGFAL